MYERYRCCERRAVTSDALLRATRCSSDALLRATRCYAVTKRRGPVRRFGPIVRARSLLLELRGSLPLCERSASCYGRRGVTSDAALRRGGVTGEGALRARRRYGRGGVTGEAALRARRRYSEAALRARRRYGRRGVTARRRYGRGGVTGEAALRARRRYGRGGVTGEAALRARRRYGRGGVTGEAALRARRRYGRGGVTGEAALRAMRSYERRGITATLLRATTSDAERRSNADAVDGQAELLAQRGERGSIRTAPLRARRRSHSIGQSMRSVASFLYSIASRAALAQRRGELVGAADVDAPLRAIVGDVLDRGATSSAPSRPALVAPAGDAGDAVGGIADEREPVRDRFGPHAVLRDHAGLVEDLVLPAIPAHDVRADRRTGTCPCRPRRSGPGSTRGSAARARRGGRDRVVGLELDHRPRDEPERRGARAPRARTARPAAGRALRRSCSRRTDRCGTIRSRDRTRRRRA